MNLSASSSGIRDNHNRGSVGGYLREKIQPGSILNIVSAYFTIYAFDALREELQNIDHLNFLFGEPRFISSLDPDKTDKKSFQIEDQGLTLRQHLVQREVARACAEWIEKKVEIRSIKKSNLLHGKMYHLQNGGVSDAILGSSNFTVSGLGLGSNSNIELNLEVDSTRDRNDLKSWFDELWNNENEVEDVKGKVLEYLEQLYANHAPEFIYFKTLFHVFEKFLAEQTKEGLDEVQKQLTETAIWNELFPFQMDGAKGAINKLRDYNGCIIADSVGLGKTYEALAVIKYFELRNKNVLVLCPKKLSENWTIYQAHTANELNPFPQDKFSYTVLSHTDLSRNGGYSAGVNLSKVNWGNFDLVVIDESHNFRNNAKGRRDEEGNILTRTRYEKLMDDIVKAGVQTKVLLLSATPVNNDLKDLRNQIYLLTGDNDSAFETSLGIPSIKNTLEAAQRTFSEWAKDQQKTRGTSDLLEKLNSALFVLLDGLTIARSRRHIQKYYAETLKRIGQFPHRLKPISIYPNIDTLGRFPSYERLDDEISNYKLSLFNPSRYVRTEHKAFYENKAKSSNQNVPNFSQETREHFLIGMMKVNFLKRLESSVNSFEISMNRTMEKIEKLEGKIRSFQERHEQGGNVEIEGVDEEEVDDETASLMEEAQVGGKLKFDLAHLDIESWLKDLAHDKQQLNSLYLAAKDVDEKRDAKLKELKKLIQDRVSNPPKDKEGNPARKVLIFTAFADTADYLYEALKEWARDTLDIHLALVTGGQQGNKSTFGKTEFNHILTNFSPHSKKRGHGSLPGVAQPEIDLLIATDCISEGQNLQDCGYVVNYDIHWNPVRLIQRFGRIDRIGSLHNEVQLVNFWPTPDLNKYINLKNRVESRMALVDLTATNQDNILRTDEMKELIKEDLNYRDQQLLQLQNEVLDLEDDVDGVALNEFTLDDFKMELINYLQSNRRQLEDAPLGLYAVAPQHAENDIIAPGVVYCLRQIGDNEKAKNINQLQPYFLVYVRDDGQVRFNFTHAKRVLEIFRELCQGKSVAYEDLCRLFDQTTDNGADMTKYNGLLEKAIQAISVQFNKRNAHLVTTSRNAVLVGKSQQVTASTDFELITWLVIVDNDNATSTENKI